MCTVPSMDHSAALSALGRFCQSTSPPFPPKHARMPFGSVHRSNHNKPASTEGYPARLVTDKKERKRCHGEQPAARSPRNRRRYIPHRSKEVACMGIAWNGQLARDHVWCCWACLISCPFAPERISGHVSAAGLLVQRNVQLRSGHCVCLRSLSLSGARGASQRPACGLDEWGVGQDQV